MFRTSLTALVFLGFISDQGTAQPPAGPVQEMPRLLQHLKDAEIRAALDLTDEQAIQIESLIDVRRQIMGNMSSQLRALPIEQRRAVWNATHSDLTKLEADMAKILLPFQADRLKQIDFQLLVRADSASGGLTTKQVVEALNLTPAQQEAIQEDLKKAEEELKVKVEELRKQILKAKEEARQKVFKHMTDEQREIYAKLVGEVIERGNQ